MRLEIVRGGGLAGLVSRTELDSADLPEADARRLDDLCRAAQLEPLPAAPAPGAADSSVEGATGLREQPVRRIATVVRMTAGRRER